MIDPATINSNKLTSPFKVLMYLLLFQNTYHNYNWLIGQLLFTLCIQASSMISQKTIYLKNKNTRVIKILTNKVPLKRERHGMRDWNRCKIWHSLPTVNDYMRMKNDAILNVRLNWRWNHKQKLNKLPCLFMILLPFQLNKSSLHISNDNCQQSSTITFWSVKLNRFDDYWKLIIFGMTKCHNKNVQLFDEY